MSTSIRITSENPTNSIVLALLKSLVDELTLRYPDDETDTTLPAGVDSPQGALLVAWLDDEPIGCGAIRPLSPGVAEVKRMYVAPHMRQRGVGRVLMQALEAEARQLGYQTVCLETGTRQPEAMHLYESLGFHRIECYGAYAHNELSVCYKKHIQ